MKRNLVIVLIIFLAAVAGFVFFTKDNAIFAKETSMYKAVPVSAPAFIELNGLKSIPMDNAMVQNLIGMGNNTLFLSKVAIMDSLIQNNREVQNSLRNESFILAFDFVGESNISPLLISKAENVGKQKQIEKFLSVLYPSGECSYLEEDYSKHKITSIKKKSDKSELFYCFTGGLFIASTTTLLVEKCIRQLNTLSISDNSYFTAVNKTVNYQSEISWYINHRSFPDLGAVWLNGRSSTKINEFGETVRSNVKNNFRDFRKFAAWSELDVKLNENEIIFNGISAADDSLNHFLSIFNGQEPVRFQADHVLPKNTSFFTSYSFSDKALFFDNLERYFTHTDSYYKREDRIKKIESGFRINFKNTFQKLVKNEVVIATTVVPVEPGKKTTLFIMQTTGKSDAEDQLNNLLNAYSKRKGIELSDLKSSFEVDAQNNFTIYQFPFPSFPGIWLGKPFGMAQARFAAVYENSLAFCNSEKGLQNYLVNMVLESSLSKDNRYMKFKKNTVSRANINSYINVNRIFSLNKEVFNADVSKNFEINEDFLRKFGAVNWQVVCEKGFAFNAINVAFDQNLEEEALTTWQSNLGNTIKRKPELFLNHKNPGSKEVLVQDAENNLHQITKDGKIRWSIAVPETIMGKIHQIDYFRNGRLQYLFNTKSKLYLIDRDGKKVAHFPVEFQSPATNGVSVFDYDNNRKYRYFVAFEDKNVIAYDYAGKVLPGWKFGKTDGTVATPIQHFRVNNKDYIVFKDQSRIYIQNRKGETRVEVTAKFENSKNPLVLNLNGIPKIVATDKTGKVFYLYFNGKYTEKKMGKFSTNHFFTVDDINGDGTPDFLFVDGKELEVMDENGKRLFLHKFKNEVEHRPNIYAFSSGLKKIGIIETASNRIYLFNPDGKLHEGFPLQGNSEFSIGKIDKGSNKLSLIVGSRDGDLYNYTLN
jgi:hypothetical protein